MPIEKPLPEPLSEKDKERIDEELDACRREVERYASRQAQDQAEEHLLPDAKRGDFTAIQSLLYTLADALFANAPLRPELAAYLAEALNKIADGSDHIGAFGIKRKRGEKNTHNAFIAAYHRAYHVQLLMSDGATLLESVAKVSECASVPEDTVKWAWKKHHKLAKTNLSKASPEEKEKDLLEFKILLALIRRSKRREVT